MSLSYLLKKFHAFLWKTRFIVLFTVAYSTVPLEFRPHTHTLFEVLTVVSKKMAVFWLVAPYSLVEVYQRFRGLCYLHH
jgi:hypothetical protein